MVESSAFWVTAGSAAALGEGTCMADAALRQHVADAPVSSALWPAVGATIAVTVAGAMVASQSLDRMVRAEHWVSFS